MKRFHALIFVLVLVTYSQAQQRWTRTYGGIYDDWGRSVQQTSDGGYVVAGMTSSPHQGTACTPGNYAVTLGVGATDNTDGIANFSSRGPAPNQAPWNNSADWYRPDWNLIKPDLSAPGVQVRSSYPDDTYATANGTSAACPHVVGAVAILCQKNPNLTPTSLYNYLLDNADQPSGGGPYPNNNYGWGRLNVYRALEAVPLPPLLGALPQTWPADVHPSAPRRGPKLTAELEKKMREAGPGALVSCIVVMREEYPYEAMANTSVHDRIASFKRIAKESQAGLLKWLSAQTGFCRVKQSYWVLNGFHLEATPRLIEEIARREDVAWISYDGEVHLVDASLPRRGHPGFPAAGQGPINVFAPHPAYSGLPTTEWNITKVQAPACWAAGYTGNGVIIGHTDTGVDYTHPALAGKWTGYWLDVVNDSTHPYDDNGHGTYTMGIILGGNGPGPGSDTIGVAPGARFVSAKVLDSNGNGTWAQCIEGLQFMADLKDSVDIRAVSNSWASLDPTDTTGYPVCRTLKAIGILPVFAIGNSGNVLNVWLIKTDASGDTLWTRTYGGTASDEGESVRQTADGGYIIAGWIASLGGGSPDVYLIKTNASGDTLWTRTYGGTGDDEGYSVQQTSDGGYIITGYTDSFGAGSYDVYLIKTDASGDTLWTRTYGGTSYDWGNSVQQTSDGGYIITGWTYSYGAGNDGVYLIKTNASGDTLWTRTYGGTGYNEGWSVQQTTDGGYIIAGFTNSFGAGSVDFYLIKTNASGDTLWTRTYGGTGEDEGYSGQQTSDGGYIVTGQTSSYGAGGYDVYLLKTNASGDTLWTRTYGGTGFDAGWSVQQTSDGGYVIVGTTTSFGAGGYDVYLIKTDANGLEVEDNKAGSSQASHFPLTTRPNPFTSFARVPGHDTERFDLYDISGRKVGTYFGDHIGAGLAAGVYFLRAEKGDRKPLRVVKVR